MLSSIRPGVYPTMITPFTPDSQIDFDAVERIVEYYAQSGCDGIFAICQSSEMFFLSEEEKSQLLRTVVRAAAGRMQIVASGHTADDEKTQIAQLMNMAEQGADASVIVLNRTVRQGESDDVAKRNLERLFRALPDVTLGVYECPYPYKRMFTTDLLKWCADSGRVVFIKDTCCDLALLTDRQQAIKGSALTIYNANSSTLLASIRAGIQGYSGIMANFHADLYHQLFQLEQAKDPRADLLQDFLSLASFVEHQLYPVNAKAHMRLKGIDLSLRTRSRNDLEWKPLYQMEMQSLFALEEKVRQWLSN